MYLISNCINFEKFWLLLDVERSTDIEIRGKLKNNYLTLIFSHVNLLLFLNLMHWKMSLCRLELCPCIFWVICTSQLSGIAAMYINVYPMKRCLSVLYFQKVQQKSFTLAAKSSQIGWGVCISYTEYFHIHFVYEEFCSVHHCFF